MEKTIEIRVINDGRRQHVLREPLVVTVQHDTGGWTLWEPTLLMVAMGRTLQEAKRELEREFAVLWDEYACALDDELTSDGRELKRKLRALVVYPWETAYRSKRS